jgi:hypothetical protein
MTGSAKQSISPRKERVDCLVTSLLAMTLPHFPKQDSASSRRDASEVLQKPSALKIRGRGECRAPNAPAASRANEKAHERSHHGHTGNHPAFPAQWFYGLLRALPGDRAFLPPSSARLLADLTPASGCQNDTTSPYASAPFVKRRRHVHRIPPRVCDDRETPLRRGGTESL